MQNRVGLFALKLATECVQHDVLFLLLQEQEAGQEGRGIFWGLPETTAVSTLPGVSSVTMKGDRWGLSSGQSFHGITNLPDFAKNLRKVPLSELLSEDQEQERPRECLPSRFALTVGQTLARSLSDAIGYGKEIDFKGKLQYRMALSTLTEMREREKCGKSARLRLALPGIN